LNNHEKQKEIEKKNKKTLIRGSFVGFGRVASGRVPGRLWTGGVRQGTGEARGKGGGANSRARADIGRWEARGRGVRGAGRVWKPAGGTRRSQEAPKAEPCGQRRESEELEARDAGCGRTPVGGTSRRGGGRGARFGVELGS